jgi:hypothetical protein
MLNLLPYHVKVYHFAESLALSIHPPFPSSLFSFPASFSKPLYNNFFLFRAGGNCLRGEGDGLCEVGISPIPYCFPFFIWRPAESGKHMIPRNKVLGFQYLEKVRLKKRLLSGTWGLTVVSIVRQY